MQRSNLSTLTNDALQSIKERSTNFLACSLLYQLTITEIGLLQAPDAFLLTPLTNKSKRSLISLAPSSTIPENLPHTFPVLHLLVDIISIAFQTPHYRNTPIKYIPRLQWFQLYSSISIQTSSSLTFYNFEAKPLKIVIRYLLNTSTIGLTISPSLLHTVTRYTPTLLISSVFSFSPGSEADSVHFAHLASMYRRPGNLLPHYVLYTLSHLLSQSHPAPNRPHSSRPCLLCLPPLNISKVHVKTLNEQPIQHIQPSVPITVLHHVIQVMKRQRIQTTLAVLVKGHFYQLFKLL